MGPNKPLPPRLDVHEGPALDSLVKMENRVFLALARNVAWLNDINSNTIEVPDWGEYMTLYARENHQNQLATKWLYGPLIDAPPANPDTILTAIMFIEKFAK